MSQISAPNPYMALRLGWADWLRSFRWDYWTTMTFRNDVSEGYARHAVTCWLEKQPPGVYAAVAYERGDLGGRTHAHALVGGIGRHALCETHLLRSWRQGNARVDQYRPGLDPRGTCRGLGWYVAAYPDSLELVGTPLKWRARKRAGRNR